MAAWDIQAGVREGVTDVIGLARILVNHSVAADHNHALADPQRRCWTVADAALIVDHAASTVVVLARICESRLLIGSAVLVDRETARVSRHPSVTFRVARAVGRSRRDGYIWRARDRHANQNQRHSEVPRGDSTAPTR